MRIRILLLFFVFSFLLKNDYSLDQDLGRHLKLGEIISQTGTVPKVNLFSYTNADFPFINSHWLFEVLVYLGRQTFGLQNLLIIKIVIFLVSLWLILKVISKEHDALLLPIGFIFLHVLRERTELRPEIFSFLFTGLTLYILEKFSKKDSKLIFLLPLVQLIWVNTHIYFFIGLILQVIFLIHLSYLKLRSRLIMVFVLSVLTSFINPHGWQGFLYPINVTKNYGYTIVENQNMFLLESINFQDPNFLFVKLSAGIILISLVVVITKAVKTRQLNDNIPKNIFLPMFGLVLALLHVRSFPYLIFLSLPATLGNFGAFHWNKLTKVLTLITSILLILESYSYFKNPDFGLRFVESGKGALDFTLHNHLSQPIFNNFDIGSYIIYRGYPEYKVFVDGRPEAYPEEFFQNTYIPMQSDYDRFKKDTLKFGFKTIIFSRTDQTPWGRNFLQNVVKDRDWKTVYLDNFMIVLERNF